MPLASHRNAGDGGRGSRDWYKHARTSASPRHWNAQRRRRLSLALTSAHSVPSPSRPHPGCTGLRDWGPSFSTLLESVAGGLVQVNRPHFEGRTEPAGDAPSLIASSARADARSPKRPALPSLLGTVVRAPVR